MTSSNTLPHHELFALRYATVERKASDTFLVWREADRPMRLDFFFWAITDGTRTIVVDTGFSAYSAEKRRRPPLHAPADLLRRIGIAPESVDDVILTHLHFDHAGNTDAFPRATFHLQAREMASATGSHMTHHLLREHYEVEDVLAVLRLVHAGRVRFHDGVGEVAPGVRVHLADGHTAGLQAVEVSTARGPMVIASDAIHYYANIERENPFPAVMDVAAELNSYRRLKALAGAPERLVPSHDPQVLARFTLHPEGEGNVACLHLPLTSTPQGESTWKSATEACR